MKPKLHIGLVYDLRDEYLAQGYSEEEVAEFDSEATLLGLEDALTSLGYGVERIGNAKTLCSRLVLGDRWDIVFNITEGLRGRARESQTPCVLELYDIPYVMSDPITNGVSLDKALAKKIIKAEGLNTPAFTVVRKPDDLDNVRLKYPLFAKPIAEGTGKGIDGHSKIENPADLKKVCEDLLLRLKQPVLIEEFLPGREFTVGILGTAEDARVVGVMEINIDTSNKDAIYSYDTKENWQKCVKYSTPPSSQLRSAIESLALRSYNALECRDCARVDIRLDACGDPAFIEINTLPGLNPGHSDMPMLAKAEGMDYQELIGEIIKSALKRLKS